MPRILFPVILIISSVAAWGAPLHLMKLDELMARFDRAVEGRTAVTEAREKSISEIKMRLASATPHQRRKLAREIADRYCSLQIDSALAYYGMAAEGADSAAAEYCRGQICRLLPLKGRTAEALELYYRLLPDTADVGRMILYHSAGEGMYVNMSPGIDTSDVSAPVCVTHSEALRSLLPEGDVSRNLSSAIYFRNRHKHTFEAAHLSDVLFDSLSTPEQLGRASLMLANLCHRDRVPHTDEELHYLLQSAVVELENGITTGYGTCALGMELLSRGDKKRAFKALEAAFDNARYSGNLMAAAMLLPHEEFIERTLLERESSLRTILTVVTMAFTVIVVVLIAVLIIKSRRRARSAVSAAQHAVTEEPDEHAQSFVADYLNLFASYTENVEEMLRSMRRKLSAGKTEEVTRMLSSDRILSENTLLFTRIFESIVLRLYPDYVERVNSLLMDDRQIALAPDGRFTTELRILAMSSMGIEDASTVARFLGLSNNTIYTYRNRMRSRAIDRENFDRSIPRIAI